MPQYYIWTIGCQMNKAESEHIRARLEREGYQLAQKPEDAEVIVLNSCVVRESAETKVVNKLHDLRALKRVSPEKTIALTGCIVGGEPDNLKRSFPQVDYFFKPGEPPPWLPGNGDLVVPASAPVTAYVPIIQGCDNFCSYCIVPYRRGRETSRPLSEIVCEVQQLAGRGVKEVTLLGQNVDSYGRDLPEHPDLADLLAELNGVDGLTRIRFLTNHPKDMSRKLIDAVAALDKVCEQICLPVQAGSDEILKAMRRGYTIEEYRQLVDYIRSKIEGIALSTDIIVGFPGESADQFQRSLDLLSETKFDTVHVAVYSPRSGTVAARDLADDVPLAEKKARLRRVEDLQGEIAAGINSRLVGTTIEVLVDGKTRGKWRGRTRTDKPIFFTSHNDQMGSLVRVKIVGSAAWSLQGELV